MTCSNSKHRQAYCHVVRLCVLKPMCCDDAEWGISRYFARGGAVTFMAGPTGAMLLVCEPSEHLAPLVEEETEAASDDLVGSHVGHRQQAAPHGKQATSRQPPIETSARPSMVGQPAAPPVAQPTAGQVFLRRSASTRWNV